MSKLKYADIKDLKTETYLYFGPAARFAVNAYCWSREKLDKLLAKPVPVINVVADKPVAIQWAIRSQLLITDFENNHKDQVRFNDEMGELYFELTGKRP